MIYIGSRYENQPVSYLPDARSGSTRPTVTRTSSALLRKLRQSRASSYVVWNSVYRFDQIAYRSTMSPESWWKIMDKNSDRLNPWGIKTGTKVIVS